MTATDWAVVVLMLGAVAGALLVDRAVARRQHVDDADQDSHDRLMGEIRRHSHDR